MSSTLANTHDEWKSIVIAERCDFVRSMAEWDAAVANGVIHKTSLAKLKPDGLEKFRQELKFLQVMVNGLSVKSCCISWYYGDLVDKHGFTDAEVHQVAALFGIGPERFLATSNKFGDICDGDVCCRPRPNFNCPDGKPDCTC